MLTAVAVFCWLAGLGFSLAWIGHFTSVPGPAGRAPARWPESSQIPLDSRQSTLVLFAHPHCPCTRATLGELELLMARLRGRLHCQVCFLKPENTPDNWTNTDLWSTAAVIPGVTVQEDRDGHEARLFQAETSGQVLLYQTNGTLLFQGGITESRGHSGDNAGRSAVAALVAGELTPVVQTPVFGCSLFESNCLAGGAAWKP